jgi:hypothetical protein
LGEDGGASRAALDGWRRRPRAPPADRRRHLSLDEGRPGAVITVGGRCCFKQDENEGFSTTTTTTAAAPRGRLGARAACAAAAATAKTTTLARARPPPSSRTRTRGRRAGVRGRVRAGPSSPVLWDRNDSAPPPPPAPLTQRANVRPRRPLALLATRSRARGGARAARRSANEFERKSNSPAEEGAARVGDVNDLGVDLLGLVVGWVERGGEGGRVLG